jgi:cytochrome c-type biogenesis protein CcmE
VIALSVAALLAIFLVYTAVAGNSTPQLRPSTLAGHSGSVSVTGKVVGPVRGDAHTRTGLRFALRDVQGGGASVPVVFHGSVPDLFRAGRDVNVSGTYAHGRIAATDLTTKCPSKYKASKST